MSAQQDAKPSKDKPSLAASRGLRITLHNHKGMPRVSEEDLKQAEKSRNEGKQLGRGFRPQRKEKTWGNKGRRRRHQPQTHLAATHGLT